MYSSTGLSNPAYWKANKEMGNKFGFVFLIDSRTNNIVLSSCQT